MNRGLIAWFVQQKLVADLLMTLILFCGAFGLSQINVQFLPNFPINILVVQTNWPGTTHSGIYEHITKPFQSRLSQLPDLRYIKSMSINGRSTVSLEFNQQADIRQRYQDTQRLLNGIKLPQNAKGPYINEWTMYEPVAKLFWQGFDTPIDTVYHSQKIKRAIEQAQIGQVDLIGVPRLDTVINVPLSWLHRHQLTLAQVADVYNDQLKGYSMGIDSSQKAIQFSVDQPLERLKETLSQTTVSGIKAPFYSSIQPSTQSSYIRVNGHYGSMMQIKRTQDSDALASAKKLDVYLSKISKSLPASLSWTLIDQRWHLIKDRIDVLTKNGIQGFILILLCLFLLLQLRIAVWVAMAIPISLAASGLMLYLIGESINMISMFSLIMCLGIVVDDTVVVAEHIYARYQSGQSSTAAAISGAHSMIRPIMASSMTTIGAFFPLLILDGLMGDVLRIIPITAIAVIIASLIECFFILPSHMKQACQKTPPSTFALLEKTQHSFSTMKQYFCGKTLPFILDRPYQVIALFSTIVVLTMVLMSTGRVKFDFFPQPDQSNMAITTHFQPDLSPEKKDEIVKTIVSLAQSTTANKKSVVKHAVPVFNEAIRSNQPPTNSRVGSHLQATIFLELTEPDSRHISNAELMQRWQNAMRPIAGIRDILIETPRGGPPSKDYYVMLLGDNATKLEHASTDLINQLNLKKGVYNIRETLPKLNDSWVVTPNQLAQHFGFSYQQLTSEVLAAMSGITIQQLNDPDWGTMDIKVRLLERLPLTKALNNLRIHHKTAPLSLHDLVNITPESNRGAIQSYNGRLVFAIEASLDKNIIQSNTLKHWTQNSWLPSHPEISLSFSEQDRYQDETFASLKWSVLLGLVLIFLVVAWVTSSLFWPIIIMLSIPFGLIGGLWFHKFLDLPITLLSFFGFFGLAGIVVNNAILLVLRFSEFYKKMTIKSAVISAVEDRFRAMFLTTITTILALLPLLTETSVQAAYLKPMVAALCGGLFSAALMVLILLPVLLLWLGPKWQSPTSSSSCYTPM